jgi:hypothetical protein
MPIVDADTVHVKVAAVEELFKGRVYITAPELEKLFGISIPTRLEMVSAAGLPFRKKGVGVRRPRRVFTIDDVYALLAFMRKGDECPTTNIIGFPGKASPATGRAVSGRTAPRSTGKRAK